MQSHDGISMLYRWSSTLQWACPDLWGGGGGGGEGRLMRCARFPAHTLSRRMSNISRAAWTFVYVRKRKSFELRCRFGMAFVEDCRRSKRALALIRVDYRKLVDFKLPKAPKKVCTEANNELYPVRVVERTGSRAKVHCVGYSNSYDEYSELEAIDTTGDTEEEQDGTTFAPLQSYSIYRDLSIKIKLAMSCGRKTSPTVRISMPFDILHFKEGLKLIGVPSRRVFGNQNYNLKHYRDLNHLLGSRWHYRGLR